MEKTCILGLLLVLSWYRLVPVSGTICGQTSFSSGQGTVTSPSYPSNYPNFLLCNYDFTASGDDHVWIKFTDFRLEEGPSCVWDDVSIYDTSVSPRVQIGEKYCGSDMPPYVVSPGQSLRVRFKTDFSVTNRGFSFDYSFDTIDTLGDCGITATISSGSGAITSPSYPSNYPDSSNCVYELTAASPDDVIQLFFVQFSLDSAGGDSLRVVTTGEHHAGDTVYRRDDANFLHVAGTSLTLTFTSSSSNGDGFLATYSVLTDGAILGTCGGTYTSDTGTISSPGYPGNYENSATCYYSIQVSAGHIVRLEFSTFHIAGYCSGDYLSIYAGSSPSAPLIAHYCGMGEPTTVQSSSNAVYLVFASDSYGNAEGFRAEYTAISTGDVQTTTVSPPGPTEETPTEGIPICDSRFLSDPTVPVVSHDGYSTGTSYSAETECTVVLTTSHGHKINVWIENMDIQECGGHSCTCDALEFQGIQDHDTLLFCGDLDRPESLSSSGHMVVVTFRTDSTVQHSGFKIAWNSYDPGTDQSGCTGFWCAADSMCIPDSWVCDKVDHCSDRADENCPWDYRLSTDQIMMIVFVSAGVIVFIATMVPIMRYCCARPPQQVHVIVPQGQAADPAYYGQGPHGVPSGHMFPPAGGIAPHQGPPPHQGPYPTGTGQMTGGVPPQYGPPLPHPPNAGQMLGPHGGPPAYPRPPSPYPPDVTATDMYTRQGELPPLNVTTAEDVAMRQQQGHGVPPPPIYIPPTLIQ
ncbi:PREDICTED: cubilin-like [Branchiostoma belcheri]|uniref:Cubilin-like n=1 Tax=Branchiostoma belcheri TaxID=7741 RepID=A0A6P4ZR91_BRABE|nr:PREDICTED: cubilin-like [Branchiostoma belcheri]